MIALAFFLKAIYGSICRKENSKRSPAVWVEEIEIVHWEGEGSKNFRESVRNNGAVSKSF